jgi:hypothetical protein
VAFESAATNLVYMDTNSRWDMFVRDRVNGTTERASVASNAAQGDGESYSPSISADGRYVVFYSLSDNLVAGDTNGAADVFVHDRQTGATERVSVGPLGAEGNGESDSPSISADVAFRSAASNLVSGTSAGSSDVRARPPGRRDPDSERRFAGAGRRRQLRPWINADGRYGLLERRQRPSRGHERRLGRLPARPSERRPSA